MTNQARHRLLQVPIQLDHLTEPQIADPDPHLEAVLAAATAREAAAVAFGTHWVTRPVVRALAASLRGGEPGDPVDLFPLSLAMALAPRLDPDRLAACLHAADPDALVRTPLLVEDRDLLARATAATGPRRLVRLARTVLREDHHRVELTSDICPILAELHPVPAFDIATPAQLHRAACGAWGDQHGHHRPLGGGQAALAGLDGRSLETGMWLVVPRTVAEFGRAAAALDNCLWQYPPVVHQPDETHGVLLVYRESLLIAAGIVIGRELLDLRGPGNRDIPPLLHQQVSTAVLAAAGPRQPPTAWSPTWTDPAQPTLWTLHPTERPVLQATDPANPAPPLPVPRRSESR